MQYHAIIKTNKKEYIFWFDLKKEELENSVTLPFNEHKRFFFYNKIIDPLDVKEIWIFCSSTSFNNVTLPNGRIPIDEENGDYVVNSLSTGKVSGVNLCTNKFILPPSERSVTKNEYSLSSLKNKVFIVHGRDEASAFKLKDHLVKKGINAEMFEDFKERITGNTTVIEELIKIKDEISYAFVIATADDVGNLSEVMEDHVNELVKGKPAVDAKDVCSIMDRLNYRARQNVLFEYGLFLGVLGREKVECLWDKRIGEEPSDIKGVLNIHFEKSIRETFPDIDAKIDKISPKKIT